MRVLVHVERLCPHGARVVAELELRDVQVRHRTEVLLHLRSAQLSEAQGALYLELL